MGVVDTDPHFAAEAQEVFVAGARVFAVDSTVCVKEGSEGVYVGTVGGQAVVDWDTPSGDGYREQVRFDKVKNLYR